jgi:hypothetical protein
LNPFNALDHFHLVAAIKQRGFIGDQILFVGLDEGLFKLCQPETLPASMMSSSRRPSFSPSKMASRVRRLLPIISVTSSRPPEIVGTSRWLMMKRIEPASRSRTWVSSSVLNMPMMRLMVCGAGGVQRAENQMAGFAGVEHNLHRFAVADFADKNDFGRLPHGGAHAVLKTEKIAPQFPLAERGLDGREHKFNRIFQRDDVDVPGLVDFVQHGGHGGRLAHARAAGHKDDAVLFLDDLPESDPG